MAENFRMPMLGIDPIYGPWISTPRTEPKLRELFAEHYSAPPTKRPDGTRKRLVGPAGDLVILTTPAYDAMFIWQNQKSPHLNGQTGLYCSVFRRTPECPWLASDLIIWAENWAIHRWPGETRLFTYVHPSKVASRNPGYCFQRAGWRKVGKTVKGLLIFAKDKIEPEIPPGYGSCCGG